MSALDEIKARIEKATPGPWDVSYTHGRVDHLRNGIRFTVADLAFRDAEFIAHARTDIPKLLAALEAVLSHASAEVEDYRDRRGSMIEYDQLEAAGRADYAEEVSQRIREALS